MENNNFNSGNDRQAEINIDKEIENLKIGTKKKSNKLPVILMICVLAIALITGILLIVLKTNDVASNPVANQTTTQANDPAMEEFYSSAMEEVITDESGSEISREEYITQIQQQIQDATTVLNQYVGSHSPNHIVEITTNENKTNNNSANNNSTNNNTSNENTPQAENTTVSAEMTTVSAETLNKTDLLVKAFFNKKFFLKGALYSGGTGDPIHMAMDGDNFEVLTNIDGTELSFLRLDKKMYIKRAATKQYVSLTTAFFKLLGMDPESLTFDFGDVDYDKIKNTAKISNVKINNNPGICYTFKNDTQSFKFYFEKEELRQIVIYDNSGTVVSEFSIDYFSETIPADQLTVEGYKKTGIGTLFADLM